MSQLKQSIPLIIPLTDSFNESPLPPSIAVPTLHDFLHSTALVFCLFFYVNMDVFDCCAHFSRMTFSSRIVVLLNIGLY